MDGLAEPRVGAEVRADTDWSRRPRPIQCARCGTCALHAGRGHGRLLDGSSEQLAATDVLHVEMEELMHHKALVPPVLTYLFHRLEARFDGRPTLLILDEAWTFLDDALFAARIREWLKTLRKKNVAVVFATQSLADIERSTIAPALIESCPTRIFLPNDRALEPQAKSIYERFGLNVRQIEILSTAAPKRDYYAQTARGNRLFELGLGPVALALCGASTPDDHKLIDRCLAEDRNGSFASRFLQAKGLPWAAELLVRSPQPAAPPPIPQASYRMDPAEGAPAAPAAAPHGPAPSPKAAARAVPPRPAAAPLPGLPGGPPMPERLSPFRVVAGSKSKRKDARDRHAGHS